MWSNFIFVFVFLMIPLISFGKVTVRRVSVPEDHHLYLACSGAVDFQWTHEFHGIIVTKQGRMVTYLNHEKYKLQLDGSLLIKELKLSDSGHYHCNNQLMAEVQVLKGQSLAVSSGRALLLPCKVSAKHKQKWAFKKHGHVKQAILTLFKNGTVKKEREDPHNRFSYNDDALQILNLQPGDSGEYTCNRNLSNNVTVLKENPDHLNIQSTTVVMETDVERKNKQRSLNNVVVLIAVIGLCIVMILAGLLCILLIGRPKKGTKKCNTGCKQEGIELKTTSVCWLNLGSENTQVDVDQLEDTEVQYASLGRQNWRERSRVQGADKNHVIYSAVVTAKPGVHGLERRTH
ncbi:uncharacterized protein LOC105028063 isoform X2 [Esox lucius]|uniref:uncharacterized protein LOC105028063 isoform X2 n=1 Tax=Esox lucius TaxID=8010 RepID=UPI0005780E6E|nr:uncharacterized protein LOC105028063 isoform X2 [Esox lucius]